MNLKQQIKNRLWNKTWKKCLLLFVVIFLIILAVGVSSINFLDDVATNKHIHSVTGTVTDKYYGDTFNEGYYIVVIDNNKTLSIVDHGDGYGKKMWQKLEINNEYYFIVKEPELVDIHSYTRILQVKNEAS